MFKKFIVKYMVVSIGLTLSSFILLFVLVAFFINGYSTTQKEKDVHQMADSVAKYMEVKNEHYGTLDVSDTINAMRKDENVVFAILMAGYENTDLFIADNDGKIVSHTTAETTEFSYEKNIPNAVMDEVNNGEEFSWNDTLDDFFTEPHIIYAVPIYNENNFVCGTVFACSEASTLIEFGSYMTKTFLLAMLWVILISIIIFYCLLIFVVDPIKAMSYAAQEVANSDYKVRVAVRGDDEIARLAESFNKMADRLMRVDDIMRTTVKEFSRGQYSARISIEDGELTPLANAFNEMAEKIQKLDNMRTDFMASVSHDLRSPMTSIIGFVDGILNGAISPENHTKYLKLVREECMRLSGLVQQLLDLSGIQTGDRKFIMKPFDICEKARIILLSFERKIDEKHLDVEFNCDRDNMAVIGDSDAIHRVLYNLCDNAIKFSRDGGRYVININDIDDKIKVTVFNEGIGIPQDKLPFIFERFYKVDASRGNEKVSSGLGLYISKLIMDAHGQTIEAESEFEQWCKMSITLEKALVTTDARLLRDDNDNGIYV